MDKRAQALRVVLDELAIPVDVSTIEHRKTMQKAVYLAQAAGVPLGYRFSWYVMGPYSPDLTDDYYRSGAASDGTNPRELREKWQTLLGTLKPILSPPQDQELTQAQWLELLASWHFLRSRRRQTVSSARETMEKFKPRLAPEWKSAERVLDEASLLV